MGSSARMDRNYRFIEEFNALACKRYSFEEFPCFESQSLGEFQETVAFFVMIHNRGRQEELMLPIIFFDPGESSEEMIGRVMELFDLDEDSAKSHLQNADLI